MYSRKSKNKSNANIYIYIYRPPKSKIDINKKQSPNLNNQYTHSIITLTATKPYETHKFNSVKQAHRYNHTKEK